MARIVRSCIQSLLKMVNSVIGMVGIAMIMYALWLLRVWQRQMVDFPIGDDDPVPWCASLVYSEILLCGCAWFASLIYMEILLYGCVLFLGKCRNE